MNTLLWLQRDLRLIDNPALDFALATNQPVIAVYIHSPLEDAPWAAGAASRWWLHNSLQKLEGQLAKRNIKLHFFNENSIERIMALVNGFNIDTVVWTNRHEPQRVKCEHILHQKLNSTGIAVQRFRDDILGNPELFMTASKGTPYRVFTPFYKRLRREMRLSGMFIEPDNKQKNYNMVAPEINDSLSLRRLELLDTHEWHQKLYQYWSPGYESALAKLDQFVDGALQAYIDQRDYPAISATSSLSPHLHFGEISPRTIVAKLAPLIEFEGGTQAVQAEAFLRQLIWREFARYILWHYPETATEPMNKKFTSKFWKNEQHNLIRWQRGNTGIPIIDAGMRELWQTGAMHNRVRMLTASILTKNMQVAWQHGARWFWDTLVDADLANNSMGWQWVAGCGVDAAPYFRIFNPETQALKFDKQQQYVKRWQPKKQSSKRDVIELASSRKEALNRYTQLIKKGKGVVT